METRPLVTGTYPEQMVLPLPTRMHARFEGRWFVCDHYPLPGRPQESILVQHIDLTDPDWAPAPGFKQPRTSPDSYIRRVEDRLIEARMNVRTTCRLQKRGPFVLTALAGVGPIRALLDYEVADREWAGSLAGFEIGDHYVWGARVFGNVPLEDVSDIETSTEEFPAHYDDEFFRIRREREKQRRGY